MHDRLSDEYFLVRVQHGGHGVRTGHFDIRGRGRSGSGAPAALPRPREPGPGVRPVGSGRVLRRACHSERERARGKSSVVDLVFPVRQARGFRIPEEDFPVGGVHGGFGSGKTRTARTTDNRTNSVNQFRCHIMGRHAYVSVGLPNSGAWGLETLHDLCSTHGMVFISTRSSRGTARPAGSRQPRELRDQVVRGSRSGSPELVHPRVEVLEDERVVRPELRPRGVVELVHLREVAIEVGRGKRGVRRIAGLGYGVGLHPGDEAVEDGGSLALGEA